MTSEERRVRIPYRLDSDEYCTYESDSEYSCVRMGDMVTVCYDDYDGAHECSGELKYVDYGWGGFIDSVFLFQSEDSRLIEVPCDGLFYRMEDEHGND